MSNTVPPADRIHYFQAPECNKEQLAPFGVLLCKPVGQPYYYWDDDQKAVYKDVGVLFVLPRKGRIDVVPHRGITESDKAKLLGAGEWAFTHTPSKASGWGFRNYKSGPVWRTCISVGLDPNGDSVAKVISAHVENMASQTIKLRQQITEVAR